MTHVVDVGVHSFSIKAFFAYLLTFLDVLADPNIPVHTKDDVHATWHGEEMGFQPPN